VRKTDSLHVWKQRRAAVEEQAAVHHDRSVVAVGGKSRSRTEEGEL
jgi:hypothetical protein